MFTPIIVERTVQRFRLRGVVSHGSAIEESCLDEQTDPQYLNFSGLSGYQVWEIEAEFEGGYTAAIVTCNWQGGGCFIAHGEYHFWPDTKERIVLHGCIIPFVKNWLTHLWEKRKLYGILRDSDAIDCPHLEIFGVLA